MRTLRSSFGTLGVLSLSRIWLRMRVGETDMRSLAVLPVRSSANLLRGVSISVGSPVGFSIDKPDQNATDQIRQPDS